VDVKGLAEYYKDYFPIGVAASASTISAVRYKQLILDNFTQITPENETKPDAILSADASRNGLPETYTHAAVNFDRCKNAVKFCVDNGMQMRLHTLVWHSQTPYWFFTEDYTRNGKLVSREVMLRRMENYIKDVIEYFDTNYPGLIYAIDVCNEAFDSGNGDENGIRKVDNQWYETVGPDYYYQAFVFARKYAPDYMKLFYNDYGCSGKYTQMIKHLAQAKEEGLIDGIGMQSHLSLSDRVSGAYYLAMKAFLEAGYELQVTELDIGMESLTDNNLALQARKYKVLFNNLMKLKDDGYNVSSVTLWGISDNLSWRTGKYPLLFDSRLNPKKAYYGALQDPSIPTIE
jgi:GH35 family endo-1,4-beta-xylanase